MSGLSVEPNRGGLWFRFFPVEPPARSGFFHYDLEFNQNLWLDVNIFFLPMLFDCIAILHLQLSFFDLHCLMVSWIIWYLEFAKWIKHWGPLISVLAYPIKMHLFGHATDFFTSLSVGQSNGSSEPVASMEKSSLAIGQLQISDSKGISDLEGNPEKLVNGLGPDVRLSLIQSAPSISGECIPALDPVLTPAPEVHGHGETVSTKHAYASQLAAGEKVVSNDVSTASQGTIFELGVLGLFG
jgi:hypothetical protein